MRRFFRSIGVLVALALAGCGGGVAQLPLLDAGKGADEAALQNTVDEYFAAPNADAMRQAVARAEQLAKDSGEYHFIAADLAELEDRQEDRFNHLLAAARDIDSSVAEAALMEFWNLPWSDAQQLTAIQLLKEIAARHPSPAFRAFASAAAHQQLRDVGQVAAADDYLGALGWRLPLSTIGTWDNAQGKAFDIPLPPESEIDFSAKYPAKTVDAAWRENPPLDPDGKIDFTEILYPASWVVGYAYAAFDCAREGEYELRAYSTDDLKIWIDGELVFSDRNITGSVFDQVAIPLKLGRGTVRVLFKTAQDGDSSWNLFARMTGPNGAPVGPTVFTPHRETSAVKTEETQESRPLELANFIGPKLQPYRPESASQAFFAAYWSEIYGLDTLSVQTADAYRTAFPNSFRANYALAMILWNKGERSKANTVLSDLFEKHSDDFVQVQIKQARFWQQSSLSRKARDLLLQITERHPESREAMHELADWYESEGWSEDQCAVLERIDAKWPGWRRTQYELASCYANFKFDSKVLHIYRSILEAHPREWAAVTLMSDYAAAALDFVGAEETLQPLFEMWPTSTDLWSKVAFLRMRTRDFDGAREAIARVREKLPDSPGTYNLLATIAYLEKKTADAVALWKESLVRAPDDSALEERLSYLSPEKPEEWQKDIPTEEAIAAAVASRETIARDPGASVALLLDHSVVKLNIDGSVVRMVTSVSHAYNQDGRDALITHETGCSGRLKVLHAYSVSPSGERTESSDVDGSAVLFRGLEVGATIAVQVRCEEPPDSVIGDYFSHGWSFQGFRQQYVDSRFILWAPKGVELLESFRGDILKETEEKGALVRRSWSAKSPPVLSAEQSMPPSRDTRWMLQVSTVPDWGMFFKWEDALLHEAVRESPEILALAKRLFENVATKEEKLKKIQAYLTTEIRYKREYENSIAGVKPHPAPVVLARGYGDCKDKSVLFLTLAKLAGIEMRYALVRTRDIGQVIREVPSQQFNHAIVYVPKQEGVAEARFIDPTADGWDVDVLRTDDPGTYALVSDFEKKTFEWIQIPFQAPEKHATHSKVDLVLTESGGASGTLDLRTKGSTAATLRVVSRDAERFSKVLQSIANAFLTGAVVTPPKDVAIDDVEKEVHLNFEMKTDTFARKNDRELVFDVPTDANADQLFVLEKRVFPLVMPIPQVSTLETRFELPKGAKIVKAPRNLSFKTPCIQYERAVEKKRTELYIRQSLTYSCEQISPSEYPEYRAKVQSLRKSLEEDVTLKLKK